jgi:hypothetical protein
MGDMEVVISLLSKLCQLYKFKAFVSTFRRESKKELIKFRDIYYKTI